MSLAREKTRAYHPFLGRSATNQSPVHPTSPTSPPAQSPKPALQPKTQLLSTSLHPQKTASLQTSPRPPAKPAPGGTKDWQVTYAWRVQNTFTANSRFLLSFIAYSLPIIKYCLLNFITTVVAKIIRTVVFSTGFKSVISIFCCSVSDLISSIIHSVWNDMKKQKKLRQTKSRRTVATSPRCFKKPTCRATVLLKDLDTCVKML